MDDETPKVPPLLLSHGYCWLKKVSQVEDGILKVDGLECKIEQQLRIDRCILRYKIADGWSDSTWLLFPFGENEWFMQRYR
jgi:hypothetical protein